LIGKHLARGRWLLYDSAVFSDGVIQALKRPSILLWVVVLIPAIGSSFAVADDTLTERGRYLGATTGCNDCHTAGYAESGGGIPQTEWLTGIPVGYSGPWGTTYAANLRRTAANMDEAQFIAKSRSPLLPPMPWFGLRDLTDEDVAAIYRFIRSLGPAGEDMPAYVPPE
jgi:mono/diheme cytochrome c family protein